MSRRADWLVGQLPMGMLDDSFFVRFTSLFQEVATTLMAGADNMENVVDVTVAPPELARWLGSWIGMHTVDSSLDEGLQRRLIRQSSRLLAWRGTRRGLEEYLEVLTGGPVQVEESGGIGPEGTLGERPPHVVVRVQSIGWMSPEEFVAVVADEIPASAMFEVFQGDRQLWPTQIRTNIPPGADPARQGDNE